MLGRSKFITHDAGVLRVPSGIVSISDAAYFWDSPTEIDLGTPVDLRATVLLDSEQTVREVRMETDRELSSEARLVGELQLDFSLAIACDRVSWARGLGSMSEQEYLDFQSSLDDKWLVDRVALDGCPDGLLFRAAADAYCIYSLYDSTSRVVGCVIVAE
jgi:hypothetical protein